MQTLAPSVVVEVRHPMNPVAPLSPIQLHAVLSTFPFSSTHAFHSPGI